MAALHPLARYGPNLAFDLVKTGKAQRARADASQDQQAQGEVGYGTIGQTGIEVGPLGPW